MKKFLPYALSLICLAIPTKKAWAAENRAKLVQIYCQAMIESDANGRVPHAVNWVELQTRMERRRLEAKAESESMKRCVREHADDFESAELILTGRESVQESLRERKETKNPDESTEIEVNGVTMEVKPISNYAMNEKEIARDAKQRAERYGQMWQRFMGGLKRKTSEELSLR